MEQIVFRNVTKIYEDPTRGQVEAVSRVDLEISQGSFLCILGPSGCGKSTLLSMLGGFTPPTTGNVMLDGQEVTKPGPERGVVFQGYALFPWLNVLDNIRFGLTCRGRGDRDSREVARRLVKLFGLDGFETKYPHELSGGMSQRVAIARTLANDPKVLLMDEPFAAVDALTREFLQDELLRIWEQDRKTIMFVTHSIMEAAYLGDEVLVLAPRPGRILHRIPIRASRPRHRSDPEFLKEYAALDRLFREDH